MGKLPVRAVLVFCLFVLSAIGYLDRTNLSIAGPQIMREYGLNDIRLGWMMSAFLLGYAGSQVFAGYAAVRMGPRRALAAGALWWGVFTAANGTCSGGAGAGEFGGRARVVAGGSFRAGRR